MAEMGTHLKDTLKKKVNNKYCSVKYCTSKYSRSDDISIHTFPKNRVLRKTWQLKLKIGKQITGTMYVCSDHFRAEDYYLAGYAVTTKSKGLKPDSVPSQKLPSGSHDRPIHNNNSDRENRVRKRDQTKLDCTVLGEDLVLDREIDAPCDHFCNDDVPLILPDSGLELEEEPFTQDPVLEIANIIAEGKQSDIPSIKVDKEIQVNVLTHVLERKFRLSELILNEVQLRTVTGLPCFTLLHTLAQCVDQLQKNTSTLTTKDKIILVMTKLKVGLTFNFLCILFQISPTTCRRIFHDTVIILSEVLKTAIVWPEKEEIMSNMPKCFDKYRKVRVVLDCTEIPVEKVHCLKCRILTYSHYYKQNTVKFLVGVSPAGIITFISKAYGGRASDKAITINSGIFDLLDPYDNVMVDKGFMIESECNEQLFEMVQPAFLCKNKQLSKIEAIETADIAAARVHVERVIQRIKLFNILRIKLQWTLLPYLDYIAGIICGVVNLSNPILADDKF